jgi:uncharacterized protein YceK
MKKLAWIALIIMVLGLSGCACSGTCNLMKEDWHDYWRNPGAGDWQYMKQDWSQFWE